MEHKDLQEKNRQLEEFIEEFLDITLVANTNNCYRGKQCIDALALLYLFDKIIAYKGHPPRN